MELTRLTLLTNDSPLRKPASGRLNRRPFRFRESPVGACIISTLPSVRTENKLSQHRADFLRGS